MMEEKSERELLDIFFDESSLFYEIIEGKIDEFEKYKIIEYILKLNSIEYRKFIQYILKENKEIKLKPKDVFQYSKFEDTNINICEVLNMIGNKGYTLEEIGKYLLRKKSSAGTKGANVKYGENHVKTAEEFGLAKVYAKKVFLTKLGCIFEELNEESRNKLIKRLALRTNLIKYIILKSIKEDIVFEDEIDFLSKSTKLRRKNNVNIIFDLVKNNGEINLDLIFNSIKSKEGFIK